MPTLCSSFTDGLHERRTLDVADGSSDLRYYEVVMVFLSERLYVSLNLVGYVWHHLDGFSEIVATALLVDNSLVDASRSERVRLSGLYASEAFVVAEVEVCLHSVNSNVALAVLVRV